MKMRSSEEESRPKPFASRRSESLPETVPRQPHAGKTVRCWGRSATRSRKVAELELDEDAGLADRLWAARETAEAVKPADGRSRAALYRRWRMAYDFAVAARRVPDDYAELLEESGVKAQARAPMTPIVKLVFGDRLRQDPPDRVRRGAVLRQRKASISAVPGLHREAEGGLKALVAAERKARRPEPKPDKRGEWARARFAPPLRFALGPLPTNEEFALVITRRNADGVHEVVAVVATKRDARPRDPPGRTLTAPRPLPAVVRRAAG